jgi:transketolase
VEAFGCQALEIDGHNVEAIDQAYRQARAARGRPVVIIARTLKGRGVAAIENKENWHGKPLPKELAEQAIEELGGQRDIRVDVAPPPAAPAQARTRGSLELPSYEVGDSVATRTAYGDALKALGAARPDVVGLDGEVSNSTYSETFGKAFPDRFFEMYIAEQQMVATAVGLAVRGYVPFASSFAAFFSRAYDFIRMAGVSEVDIRLCGSHAGVSIGEDGPSQMALEDLAMMRAVHTSTVLYPCDPNQTAQLVAELADQHGISFLRTTREKTPVIYHAGERFPVGGSRVVRQSDDDVVTVVGAGITVHLALEAAETLAAEGIAVRVIDAYSVKPLDGAGLRAAVEATGARLVVAEDHYQQGGLGEAVLAELAGSVPGLKARHLAVRDLPGSAKPAELLAAAGIDPAAIAAAVRELASRT